LLVGFDDAFLLLWGFVEAWKRKLYAPFRIY
jgi:hypothetical protein